MSNHPFDVASLRRSVAWRDLVPVSRFEACKEVLLPLPWLMLELWLVAQGHYSLALVATFFLFLTLLRVAHNGYHNAIGIGRRATDGLLFLFSGLMMIPLHAVKATHLSHHAHELGPDDIEGKCGRMGFWQVMAYGPRFPFEIIVSAWRTSPGLRVWIAAESTLIAALVLCAVLWPHPLLVYHVLVMLAGECLTAFFAVWIVHRGTETHVYPARTQRGRMANGISYGMFLHAEHHLFPSVPTCHQSVLARRIDEQFPGLAAMQVLGRNPRP
jgi:fatty acid desaturase